MNELLHRLHGDDRVLLVGDTRQHEAVEAGRPYQQLQEAGMQTAQLDEIVRQKDPALKEAVEQLARGDVRAAIENLDGEGRYKKVTASSGANPTTGVTYTNSGTAQPLGSLTKVTLGSADNDTFSYDRNTGRLTQYNFNIGATPQTVQGNLTWNANGTLAKLAITDPFNSADAQTCTFGYDDLARVKSANCGTSWSQTFSLDPFGNLSKSGTVTFQPGFDQTKNWFLPTTGFDNNGNLLRDATHTYNWDAENKLTAIDTVSLTFDALGRMVEQARGSSYTQIVYSPAGSKLALMSGQALQKAFCPLPGGATAVYNSSGVIAYYRHADWLGSSRFASTPSRTKYFDVAYAPYGEDYADSGTVDLNFTGQNQDTVSGLYDFLYREYHANSGRWISPDPVGLGAVDFSNPQTWNRYAYVGNNPLNASDPLGLWRSDAFSSGLDGSCSINGFISACAMVMSFASAGGGGEFGAWCPDNQCVFNANGLGHFNSVNDMYDYNWAHLSVGPDGTVIDTSGPTDDQSKSVVEGAQGTNQPPTPPLECNSGFIQASSDAWKRAGIGSARTEAGFFVLGSVQNPSFKNFPFTNESGTVTGLAVPLGAIATVHTHPNALGAPPSPGDISNSDRVNLPFYVLSNRGLYVHNPGLKGSTLLRSRLSWLTPCK